MSQLEIASRLGLAQSTLSNKLRLLRLNDDQRVRIMTARLTERHARALLRLEGDDRENALNHIIANALNLKETEEYILKLLEPSYINGLTLLGGEPFEPENQRALLPFVKRVREAYPNKNIWAFTGFTLEQLLNEKPHPRCEATDELLSLVDVLVDGKFVLEKKNIRLRFRGSENQRLLNLPESLKQGIPILWDK